MFIAVLFEVAKDSEKLKCPSTRTDEINKSVPIQWNTIHKKKKKMTRKSTQSSVIICMGKESEKE